MTIPDPIFRVRSGAATDPGTRRALNEDSHLAAAPVFLVADGMGGHERGDVASRAVVDAFASLSSKEWLTPRDLFDTIAQSAADVRRTASTTAGAPGSTLAGLGLANQEGVACWLVFNIGDSRVYRLADGELEQVSVDHSRVQEMVDAGQIDEVAARTHQAHNVVTRALGAGSAVDPVADQWLLIAGQGERMLVCSDGLTGELTDQLIRATLRTVADPQSAAEALVAAAVAAGGRDNVTAVVVDAIEVGSAGTGLLPVEHTGPATDSVLDDDTAPDPRLWEDTGLAKEGASCD